MWNAIANFSVGALLGCALTTVILWAGVAGFAAQGRALDRPPEERPLPSAAWAEHPMERPCDGDDACGAGESCVELRLSSCESCEPGQVIRLCQPEQQSQPAD